MKKFLVSLMVTALFLTGCSSKEVKVEKVSGRVLERVGDFDIVLKDAKSNVIDTNEVLQDIKGSRYEKLVVEEQVMLEVETKTIDEVDYFTVVENVINDGKVVNTKYLLTEDKIDGLKVRNDSGINYIECSSKSRGNIDFDGHTLCFGNDLSEASVVRKHQDDRNDLSIEMGGVRMTLVGVKDDTRRIVVKNDLVDFINDNLTYDESVNTDRLSFEEVQTAINKQHQDDYRNMQNYLGNPLKHFGDRKYREEEKGFLTLKEFNEMQVVPNELPLYVTKEGAIEDALFYNKCFRSFYGPYKFLGRENFNKANEWALEEINKLEEPILVKELEDILYEAYSFIRDLHMRIIDNNHIPADSERLALDGYFYDDYYFLKDDKGYYLKDYSPKTYLTSVNGNTDLDRFLHYGIENDGEFAYIISYKDLESKRSHYVDIILGGKKFEIELRQMDGQFNKDDSEAFLVEREGYPVLGIRGAEGLGIDYKKYAKLGSTLKNQNVLIHDTRGNGGGRSGCTYDFVSHIEGRDFMDYHKDSRMDLKENNPGKMHRVMYPMTGTFKFGGTMITLVDAGQGSTGDQMVEFGKKYENGLVIGEPSKSVIIGWGEIAPYLPNSKMYSTIGNHVLFGGRVDEMPDGVGINPDIWVKSNEAPARTLAMLKYYDIKPSSDVKDIVERENYGWCKEPLYDLESDSKVSQPGEYLEEIRLIRSHWNERGLFSAFNVVKVRYVDGKQASIEYLLNDVIHGFRFRDGNNNYYYNITEDSTYEVDGFTIKFEVLDKKNNSETNINPEIGTKKTENEYRRVEGKKVGHNLVFEMPGIGDIDVILKNCNSDKHIYLEITEEQRYRHFRIVEEDKVTKEKTYPITKEIAEANKSLITGEENFIIYELGSGKDIRIGEYAVDISYPMHKYPYFDM